MDEKALREAIVAACRRLDAAGLNRGTSGNVSARLGAAMFVTPSGVPSETMSAASIARMPLDAEDGARDGAYEGPRKPSTEWRFHRDILRARPEIGAVVHTHSPFATILAIARRPIPACHYMVAAFGGPDVRVADYRTFGTQALSDAALAALDGRLGCLLANHGAIAIGPTLDAALRLAVELETLAMQYYHALLIGGPAILPDAEIAAVRDRFAGYGPLASEAATGRPP